MWLVDNDCDCVIINICTYQHKTLQIRLASGCFHLNNLLLTVALFNASLPTLNSELSSKASSSKPINEPT